MGRPDRECTFQKRPAHFAYERWKDATPLGNGETGALIFGDVGTERIRFTRADLWEGRVNPVPPEVGDTLAEVRKKMDEGAYREANRLLMDALNEKGYAPDIAVPFPVGDLTLSFSYADDHFSHYRRILHLDTAHSEIRYRMGSVPVTRTSFVSREDGLFYARILSEAPISVTLVPELPDVSSRRDVPHESTVLGPVLAFTRAGGRNGCGLLCRAGETDGLVTVGPDGIRVEGFTCLTVAVKVTADRNEREAFSVSAYGEAFRKHAERYGELYRRTSLSFAGPEDRAWEKSNEELLLDVFSGEETTEDPSSVLYEKLWKFGRYLFISGTGTYPFPLYGLWPGDYSLPWAQHVANENVQIIHWNALAGNLPELIRPLIRYYYEKIPQFRENARALFGCRGIVVSVYSTPVDGHIAPTVPVILNFTMASGWLCRNFFDYYEMTKDEETLREQILPFAVETARFIEDFSVIRDGVLIWYPSVSPENSPGRFINLKDPMAHSMPTTKNATIELAIVKETLSRLLAVCRTHGLYPEKQPVWERILKAIPPYRVNGDGAVREWQSEDLDDFYCHRHLSHLYPVFPGNEVTREEDPVLWKAFERAVDLRELGGQSGWSFAHMAGIYARLGRGEEMCDCLDYLCRACLYDNFFTIHNDWRENHLTLRMKNPPVQLDALMGIVNALQQMLSDDDGKILHLFEALPGRFRRGSARGLAFRYGTVDLCWDLDTETYRAVVHAVRDGTVTVETPVPGEPGRYGKQVLSLRQGESYSLEAVRDRT